jgi:hypothetical protein
MKYLLSLLAGVVIGAALFAFLVYANPLHSENRVSPLSVSDDTVITLNYSAVARDALLYTNNGESSIEPNPGKVLQLWDRPLRRTTAMVTVLTDSRGQTAGIGVKLSSDSERTNLLQGQALVDSVWHIYLPERGSMFIEQNENYWEYLRNVVVPAHRRAGRGWRGVWRGNITAGPTALNTALAYGGSGSFAGLRTEAVEALTVRAYSADDGPVAADGELWIELPDSDPDDEED